ncbi:hypothetical protein KP509_27G021000 [Ceratopteris richardii]|uniref:NAC domain-containing protein n=1 Tax=Ceratopteris richardii TaxID=49495 RepID=A0A8T2RED1_CERRI|nr:hypothetical protein KP509_27G021000 [Ceratopteris richardii]
MEGFAPGYRFRPTDEELLMLYLKPKAMGGDFPEGTIADVDIYKHEPWDLPGKSALSSQDKEWYFFATKEKKYSHTDRANRTTIKGYWKATGRDKKVEVGGLTVGCKKTLIFYEGRAPKGARTHWVMHEYRLSEELEKQQKGTQVSVVCRIRNKDKVAKRQEYKEQSASLILNEDDDEDVKPHIINPPNSTWSFGIKDEMKGVNAFNLQNQIEDLKSRSKTNFVSLDEECIAEINPTRQATGTSHLPEGRLHCAQNISLNKDSLNFETDQQNFCPSLGNNVYSNPGSNLSCNNLNSNGSPSIDSKCHSVPLHPLSTLIESSVGGDYHCFGLQDISEDDGSQEREQSVCEDGQYGFNDWGDIVTISEPRYHMCQITNADDMSSPLSVNDSNIHYFPVDMEGSVARKWDSDFLLSDSSEGRSKNDSFNHWMLLPTGTISMYQIGECNDAISEVLRIPEARVNGSSIITDNESVLHVPSRVGVTSNPIIPPHAAQLSTTSFLSKHVSMYSVSTHEMSPGQLCYVSVTDNSSSSSAVQSTVVADKEEEFHFKEDLKQINEDVLPKMALCSLKSPSSRLRPDHPQRNDGYMGADQILDGSQHQSGNIGQPCCLNGAARQMQGYKTETEHTKSHVPRRYRLRASMKGLLDKFKHSAVGTKLAQFEEEVRMKLNDRIFLHNSKSANQCLPTKVDADFPEEFKLFVLAQLCNLTTTLLIVICLLWGYYSMTNNLSCVAV